MYDVIYEDRLARSEFIMSGKSPRRKLSQEVVDGILRMIDNGEILVGDRIPTENELATRFQVSRTAVREGVGSLVALGVLQTRRGIGTFIRDGLPGPLRQPGTSVPSSLSLLLDLLEFRLIVEPETAALAAQRRTAADLEELQRCVVELEKGVARGERPPEDLGFHLALAHAARNSALVDASSLIARFYEGDTQLPDALDIVEHRAIYEAVRAGDAGAARQRMRAHLSRMIQLRSHESDETATSPPNAGNKQSPA